MRHRSRERQSSADPSGRRLQRYVCSGTRQGCEVGNGAGHACFETDSRLPLSLSLATRCSGGADVDPSDSLGTNTNWERLPVMRITS
jgi:hypothetical protein